MLLFLVRHGETEANLEKRFQGQANYPLNSRGKRQVKQLAKRLQEYPLQRIYASDLQRTEETARIIAVSQEKSFFSHPLFREFSWGVIEGLTKEEIRSIYPWLEKRKEKNLMMNLYLHRKAGAVFSGELNKQAFSLRVFPKMRAYYWLAMGVLSMLF